MEALLFQGRVRKNAGVDYGGGIHLPAAAQRQHRARRRRARR